MRKSHVALSRITINTLHQHHLHNSSNGPMIRKGLDPKIPTIANVGGFLDGGTIEHSDEEQVRG